ncbi:unnamed protein product [Candida parapsilosis]
MKLFTEEAQGLRVDPLVVLFLAVVWDKSSTCTWCLTSSGCPSRLLPLTSISTIGNLFPRITTNGIPIMLDCLILSPSETSLSSSS